MRTTATALARTACALRWSGRILGALEAALVLYIGIGEGLPNPFAQPARIQAGFASLALLMAGYAAAWFREMAGGVLALASWAAFWLFAIGPRWPPHAPFILLLGLPGLCCVGSAWLRRP